MVATSIQRIIMENYNGLVDYATSPKYIGLVLRSYRIEELMDIEDMASCSGCDVDIIRRVEDGESVGDTAIIRAIASNLPTALNVLNLTEERKDAIRELEKQIIEVVGNWTKNNWCKRPASTEKLVHRFRSSCGDAENVISYLDQELGQLETTLLMERAVDYAVELVEIP